ncbi:MAG: hypothetical protein IPL26_20840 [Leptospiraceae bacterium]|nr:hypothetical protein [Leptospiraceae bacterium]
MRQYSIIFLIVFLFSFLALKADDNLINGYIEVSDIDHVYLLTGDWKFYSGKNPNAYKREFDDSKWELFPLPSIWLYKNVSNIKNGWYRLHIRISNDLKGETLGLITPNIQEAHRAYFNGVLIGKSGEIDKNGNIRKESAKSDLYSISPDLVLYDKDNILAFEVANYRGGFGGIYNIPYFGSWELIKKKFYKNLMWISSLCFLLFILGFYHLILFWGQRKEKIFFYYSALSFSFSFFILVNYKINLWLMDSFVWEYILFTLSTGLIGVLLYLLALTLFDEPINKVEKILIRMYFFFILIHISCIFHRDWLVFRNLYLMRINILFTTLFAIRAFIIILKSVFAKKQSARITLFGYFIASPFLVIDLLRIFSLIKVYSWFISEGSVIIMITYAYAIALKNAKTHEKLIQLQTSYKEELQNQVIQKTSDLSKANEALAEVNELKNRIFSIISHDLRSPLDTLNEIIFLFQNKRYTKEKFKKYLDDISVNLKRNRFFLGNLLNWSYAQLEEQKNLPQENLEVRRILEEILEFLQPNTNKKLIQLRRKNFAKNFVLGNENALRIVFGNILSNAIKFTNPYGIIYISMASSQDYCVVSIADNGIGIEPERMKLILSRKELVSEPGTNNELGTGIGLKICLEFLYKLNGKLEIDSVVNRGSTFRIYLPKSKEIIES